MTFFSVLFAAQLVLTWEYPRDIAATAFVVVVRTQGQSTTLLVPASTQGACEASPDQYCGIIPCVLKANHSITVQAETPKGESGFSSEMTCTVNTCGCRDVIPIPTAGDILTPFEPTSGEIENPVVTEPPFGEIENPIVIEPPTPEPHTPVIIEQPPEVPTIKNGTIPDLTAPEMELPVLH